MNAVVRKLFILLLAGISPLSAAPVFTTAGGAGTATDRFDVSQGARVITSSAQYSGFFGAGCCGESDARSAFGFLTAAYSGASGWVEPPNAIFRDGPGAGTTDYIEWQTPGPVNLTAFELRLQQDGDRKSTRLNSSHG